MTQALNLALFANKLNTSGATDNTGLQNSSINIATTSPIAGGANTALGGTVTITHANSGVTAASYTNANITVNAQGHITAASNGAGVSSIATGNGLSGGPITTTGTLTLACPAANTAGSSIYGQINFTTSSLVVTYGTDYSIGTGDGQITWPDGTTTGLSGTWKYLGKSISTIGETGSASAIFTKVS